MKNIHFLIGLILTVLIAGCQEARMKVVSLKVEMQENPEGGWK